jgi:hypothetical protein
MKYELTGMMDISTEDGGCAKIGTIYTENGCFFVRVQSWDEDKIHPEFSELVGKTLKVTIEVI